MKNSKVLSILALAAIAVPAFGQNEVEQRLDKQQKRIEQGEEAGSITPLEAQKLERRENAIRKSEQKDLAKHGGKLTPREKHRLNKRLDSTSREIQRKKKNAVHN